MSYRFVLIFLAAAFSVYGRDAAAVLNRYVQVTGGAALYKRYKEVRIYSTVTHADETTENLAFIHTRDGKTMIESEAGNVTVNSGVSEGVAWRFIEGKQVQLLAGKPAARSIAEAQGFDEDDWSIRYPKVSLLDNQVINGASCRHVRLTRTDGSQLERYYDAKSGLLVRETSTVFNDAGVEQPISVDLESYDEYVGILRPTVLHMTKGAETLEVHIDSVTYAPTVNAGDLELPRPVARAIQAAHSKPGDLPNAADLLDQYVEATGGKPAYDAIKTEVVKADVTYVSENVKFSLLSYVAGEKEFHSFDVPSLGKFEAGDDGEIAWEKSVLMGPTIKRHATGTRFMGPQPSEVMLWLEAAPQMQTVARDQVRGTPCYLVRMGPLEANAPSACFDTKTGLLLKMSAQGEDGDSQQLFSDYRKAGSMLVCYRIETSIDGHAASVQLTAVDVNAAIPEGIFDLPADIKTLKARRAAAQKAKGAPDAPTLKRHP